MLAGVLQTLGALMFLRLDAHTPLWCLTIGYVVFGAGAGLVSGPAAHTAVSGMLADRAGVAGGLTSTGRQFGTAAGVAVTGSLLATGGGFPAVGSTVRAARSGPGRRPVPGLGRRNQATGQRGKRPGTLVQHMRRSWSE